MRTKRPNNGQTTARQRGTVRSRKATRIAGSAPLRIVAPEEKIRVLEAEVSVLRRQLRAQLPSDVHPVAYVALRTSGLITAANSSAIRLLGRNHEDVVNQPLHQFVAASD